MKKIPIIILSIILLFATTAWSATVCLEWNANTEPDLAGYRIFTHVEGSDYIYDFPAWEGVETTCCISGLAEDETYYFVARAFDTEALESGNSNEVSCFIEGSWVEVAPDAPVGLGITSVTLE